MINIEISMEAMIFRLLLAALLGGIIGWERERKNKQAGIKTHMLVSLGSALIMLISIYGFGNELLDHPNARFDPARLAAQVVSGIGFLGAGAILRRSNHVISGLTTAATLWLVAGIGLSVGAGFYWAAVITIGIVVIVLPLINLFETRFNLFKRYGTLKIVMAERPQNMESIPEILDKQRIDIEQMVMKEETVDNNKGVVFDFRITTTKKKGTVDLFKQIWELEGVKEVRLDWKE